MGLDEVQDSCSDYKLSMSPYTGQVLLMDLLRDWKRFCVSVLGGFLWKLLFCVEGSVYLQSLQNSDTFGKTTSKKAVAVAPCVAQGRTKTTNSCHS